MLPNHNVINPVNRNYIEVENINEKTTLGQFKNALTSTKIHEKMNHILMIYIYIYNLKLKKYICLKLQDDIISIRIRKKSG